VWNPKANFKDGLHILPVITPVFPAMNSTAYVSKSTMRVIKAELNRGDALATALAISSAGRAAWEEILAPTTCFSEIRHFLCLEIASATASDHVIWFSLVESRLRALILSLESAQIVSHVRVCPKRFDNDGAQPYPVASSVYIGLFFNRTALKARNREVDLHTERQTFYDLVKRDPSFNEKTMFLLIHHVKRDDLPDAVFPEGLRYANRKRPRAQQEEVRSLVHPAAEKSQQTGTQQETQDTSAKRARIDNGTDAPGDADEL